MDLYEELTMKRQKRDRLERAQSQGYKAGLNGRSQEACPYQQIDARSGQVVGVMPEMKDNLVSTNKLSTYKQKDLKGLVKSLFCV